MSTNENLKMLRFAHLAHCSLGLLGVISLAAQAHDHHHHAPDGHSHNAPAHQHGVGHLDLVLEGNELVIELQMPAEDLLGFEHAPRTPEQHAQVAALQNTLQQPERLFTLPAAAECRLTSVELNSSLFTDTPQSAPEDQLQHADIQAHYHFTCAAAQHLQQLEVVLFESFPASQRLLLQAITPNGQYGDQLNATHNRVRL